MTALIKDKFMLYKHAIDLHKLFNIQQLPLAWVALNFDQTISRRRTHFTTSSSSNNILSNSLTILGNKIELAWLNHSMPAFKIKCKKLLL